MNWQLNICILNSRRDICISLKRSGWKYKFEGNHPIAVMYSCGTE